jgi:hypothetical protein
LVSTRRSAAALLLSVVAPACFDVTVVDPGAVIVDDFDDGDFMPAMLELGSWQCYAFNPPTNRNYRCDHTDGYLSAYSLFVEFALEDVPDHVDQYPGAGFLSYGEGGALLDLTPYRELVINLKVQSGDPSIPSEARAYVELQCRTVEGENGKLPPLGYFYLTQGISPTGEWSTNKLSIANFGPPAGTNEHIKGGIPACLRAIDGIAIALQSGLKDGRSGRGMFFIDGLSFE